MHYISPLSTYNLNKVTMKILFILPLLILITHSDNFFYGRTLTCIANNTVKCTKWVENTTLSYTTFYLGFCFSEETHTLTRDGPKSMKELRLGDEVLSYDPETGKQVYSKVIAWLHRDTLVRFKYDEIKTKEGLSFEASPYHNIAYVTPEGKIDFKFAKDFQEGDELVGFPENDPYVSTIATNIEKTGQYTPYTDVGNYYIFTSNFTGTAADSNEPMILAHVLSHVRNPNAEFPVARRFVDFLDFFGYHRQPEDGEFYLHPLFADFSFLFGSNWVQGPLVDVREFFHDQSLTPSYSSSSYFSKPSYSSYSTPSYSSSSSSYSYYPSSSNRYSNSYYSGSSCVSSVSSTSCERQRQDEMKALGLSVSIVQQTVLF